VSNTRKAVSRPFCKCTISRRSG